MVHCLHPPKVLQRRLSAEYQALLAETQGIVERAVAPLIELILCCEGLDSADPELVRYVLNLHELGLKNIVVASDDPTCIVCSFPALFCSFSDMANSLHP